MQTDKAAQLAQVVCDRYFCGWTPPEPQLIVEAVVRAMPQLFESATQEETQAFADRLVLALRARIALNNSAWLA